MNLLELPTEVLEYVASFLSAESLACLSQTCRKLWEISKIDSLWQVLVRQDYQIVSSKGWDLSYREIYTKVLRKLHGILGLKRLALVPFGGLVNVCWTEGEIQVNRYYSKPGDSVYSSLLCQQLFSLRWNECLQSVESFCVQCVSGPRPAVLAQTGKFPLLHCLHPDCRNDHILKESRFGQSDKRCKCSFEDHCGVFSNFNLEKGFNCPMLPITLPKQSNQPRSPIQQGLYTGDYGSHGVEILNFMINQSDPQRLEGLKIVGDPNVPAGNISVAIFLHKPIVLSEAEQVSVKEILHADEGRTEEGFARLLNANNNNPDLHQPFVIPEDCFDRGLEAPGTCLARYLGIGRISGHFYNHPSHCKCHFIKFSDVQFGVIWLELGSFSMFHKVKNDFPVCAIKSSRTLL